MKPKSLAIAAACALALAALGLAVQKLRQPPRAVSQAGELLFPRLVDSINEAASMTVTTADGGYRIARRADGSWGLAEKGGYPVDGGQVRKVLIAFAELEKVEPKTTDPTRYADLGVQDVQTEDSGSKLVVLRDGKDAELASLIVGTRRSGRGEPSYYVRRVGDEQSWLVKGNLDVKPDGVAWLDKKILEVKRGDVRAVETVHPGGEALLVSKGSREDTNFQVHDLPPGRELKYASVAGGMGGALEYLNFQDVIPAGDFEASEAEPVRTSYWTFDGLRVEVALHERDEKTYATFRASYDPEGPQALAIVGPPPPSPEDEPPPEGEDEGFGHEDDGHEGHGAEALAGEDEDEAETKRPAEEVRAEAEELDARLSPWVFEIAAYNKTNFTKRMEDMLKEVEDETEEDEAEEPAGEHEGTEDEEPTPLPSDWDNGDSDDPERDEKRARLQEKMEQFLETKSGQDPETSSEGDADTPEGEDPSDDDPTPNGDGPEGEGEEDPEDGALR